MRRYIIAGLLLILLVMQGMAMSLLPANLVYSDLLITPHWVFCLVIIIAIFYDRDDTYQAIWYGMIFGLLIDVAYTGVLGVYMATYATIAYILHGVKKMVHANFIAASLLAILSVAMADTMLYIIYSFVQVTTFTWGEYVTLRLLPTVAANMIFFIILYPLVKNRIEQWSEDLNNA
ncbi:rod shape-determining protein MreD [Halobacillus shinanisalinarum]|uniref:Rod shape-determining protein MreD n=1 Tax=Halobacillus shinanisalinarum TaxID=2932258 RepID=A0ABY4H134_9BACI|nr:rod shape-determining protein MreD [Halobacillus shinanisalinarum]UOQ93870.1 rod shape-determining protein MreD [Halobacillus shinanisalinarum]